MENLLIRLLRAFVASALATTLACSSIPLPSEINNLANSEKSQLEENLTRKAKEKVTYASDDKDLPGDRLKNDKIENYLNQIEVQLGRGNDNVSWTVHPLSTEVIQGMSTWLGDIFVTRGMLNIISSEAELAGLLGHEMGHLSGFASKEMGSKKSQEISGDAAQAVDKAITSTKISSTTSKFVTATRIQVAHWSQAKEEKADEFGAVLIAKAGYNPYAFADLFDRLSTKVFENPLYRLNKIQGSHKALSNRAAHLRKFLSEKGYSKDKGVRKESEYRAAMVDLLSWNEGSTDKSKIVSNKKDLRQKDLSELTSFSKEVESYRNRKQAIPLSRFMSIMSRISELTRKYHLTAKDLSRSRYRQEQKHPPHRKFMEERVEQPFPLWGLGDSEIASSIQNLLGTLSRVAVGFIPVVNDAVDLYELVSGKAFLTGEELGTGARLVTALGLIAGSGLAWREALTDIKSTVLETGLSSETKGLESVLNQVAEDIPKIEASPTLNQIFHDPNFTKADFYVRPNGDIIPAEGFRYIRADAQDINQVLDSGTLPSIPGGTYVSFNKIDDAATAQKLIQSPNNIRYRGEFDTLQVEKDLSIPRGKFGKADYLEPITKDYPEYGEGGATQAITKQPIQFDRIIDLKTKSVVYSRSRE